MITKRHSGRAWKWLLSLVLILLVQGCTNSKLIISPLYNRLDDMMRDEFEKLGDFNDEQTASFEATLGTYHVWHRQNELPQYADLMRSVISSISDANTTQSDIQSWMDTAEQHTKAARTCHPVNYSHDLAQSMTDEQLNFIEARFKKQQDKNLARYNSRTPEERVERRLRNTIKWAGRIGLQFTPTQRAMLLSTFKRQTSLRKQYYALSAQWNQQYFTLARNQENPNYAVDLQAHLDSLWSLLESNHPEEWQENRDLWKATGLRFVTSMTDDQRVTFGKWMNKMASTLDSISKNKPSFNVGDDPSIGCLVGQKT